MHYAVIGNLEKRMRPLLKDWKNVKTCFSTDSFSMQVIKSACRQTLDIVEFLLSKYYKKAMIELGLLNEDLKALLIEYPNPTDNLQVQFHIISNFGRRILWGKFWGKIRVLQIVYNFGKKKSFRVNFWGKL